MALVGRGVAEQVRAAALALYSFAAEHAKSRGIIIADTKFEFGLLPSGDILLIGGPKKCQGEFTDLPEGAAVRAEFENKTYEWKLTYRGGRSKCDIMLTSPRIAAADGRMVPYVTGRKPKIFQFGFWPDSGSGAP